MCDIQAFVHAENDRFFTNPTEVGETQIKLLYKSRNIYNGLLSCTNYKDMIYNNFQILDALNKYIC